MKWMRDIEGIAWYGNETKRLVISVVPGGGEETYQVFLDKYYCGIFLRRNGELVAFLTPAFTSDDIMILRDMILQQLEA
jgi:hypothetical protein